MTAIQEGPTLRIIPACDGQAVTGRLLNFPVTAKLQRTMPCVGEKTGQQIIRHILGLVACLGWATQCTRYPLFLNGLISILLTILGSAAVLLDILWQLIEAAIQIRSTNTVPYGSLDKASVQLGIFYNCHMCRTTVLMMSYSKNALDLYVMDQMLLTWHA